MRTLIRWGSLQRWHIADGEEYTFCGGWKGYEVVQNMPIGEHTPEDLPICQVCLRESARLEKQDK